MDRYLRPMDVRLITHGTAEYREMIRLRIRALLEPIGVPPSYIDPQKEKADFFIAAFEKEILIGCCVLTRIDSSLIQLRQMVVEPGLQARGIGASIIRFAEETARKHGYLMLMMHARDPVIGFYQKCGYTIDGGQFFEVGIGHHKMVKEL